jgi:hypothetical protein
MVFAGVLVRPLTGFCGLSGNLAGGSWVGVMPVALGRGGA